MRLLFQTVIQSPARLSSLLPVRARVIGQTTVNSGMSISMTALWFLGVFIPRCKANRDKNESLSQDCVTFAGPIDGDIDSYGLTDQRPTTCSAYIEQECQYSGERLGNIDIEREKKSTCNWWYLISEDYEPNVGTISSITDCQAWGAAVLSLGAKYFHFSGTTRTCHIFSTWQSSCNPSLC